MGQILETMSDIRKWIEANLDELFEMHKNKFYVDTQKKMSKMHFKLFANDFNNELV